MTTDPNIRVYLKVGEEWAELPQTYDGPHVVYHISAALAQAAGDSYIFRNTLELTRSPFSGGLAYRWADEEE